MEKIKEAIEHYDFDKPIIEFIRRNENMTYKIIDGTRTYLLRVHQPVEGFSLDLLRRQVSADKYIQGEMLLLEYLEGASLDFQKPVRNRHGDLVSYLLDGSPVTVLKWVEGHIVGDVDEIKAIRLGQLIADVHKTFVDTKLKEQSFVRYEYNVNLVEDMSHELDRAMTLGHISKVHVHLLKQVCLNIVDCMKELDYEKESYGYIHSDFAKDNLVEVGDAFVPIDFSLSGYGYYAMDLGMFLCKFKANAIKEHIIKGYEDVKGQSIPIRVLETFYAMGIILFIACQHSKIHTKDWYESKMNSWSKDVFNPYVNDVSFLLNM